MSNEPLPKVAKVTQPKLHEIMEEASRIFPFDERYDFVAVASLEEFMKLYAENDLGQRFYLTPFLINFYRQLKKV